jgi:hypothetical protein
MTGAGAMFIYLERVPHHLKKKIKKRSIAGKL